MVGNYFDEYVTYFIKEDKDHRGNTIYKVCYESDDGLESGYIKIYKYYKCAQSYINKIYKHK